MALSEADPPSGFYLETYPAVAAFELVIQEEICCTSEAVLHRALYRGQPVCCKRLLVCTDPGLCGVEWGSQVHLEVMSLLSTRIAFWASLNGPQFLLIHGLEFDLSHIEAASEPVAQRVPIPRWIVSDRASFSLRGYLTDRSGMDFRLLRGLADDLFRAVCLLHGNPTGPMLHGNLCPDNIVVFEMPGGVSFAVSDAGMHDVFELAYGSPYGSRFYQAPEVLTTGRVPKSDVYSIGLTLAVLVVEFLSVPGYDRVPDPELCFGLGQRGILVGEACARLLALPKAVGKGMQAVLRRLCCDSTTERLDAKTAQQRIQLIPKDPGSEIPFTIMPLPLGDAPVFLPAEVAVPAGDALTASPVSPIAFVQSYLKTLSKGGPAAAELVQAARHMLKFPTSYDALDALMTAGGMKLVLEQSAQAALAPPPAQAAPGAAEGSEEGTPPPAHP